MDQHYINLVGFGLIALGVVLVVVSALMQGKTKVETGGFVLIGPFPFVFGSSERAAQIAFALGVLFIILVLIFFFLRR